VDLVIFDCDGVLVDSEPVVNRVFRDMLADLGLAFSLDQMYDRFMGRPMQACMADVEAQLGRPAPAEFLDSFNQRSADALRAELRPVPGIKAVLEDLRIPHCVASSGDHDKMRLTLGLTGLWDRFEGRVFSVTEVPRGKPHPDVFLHAAARLGVRPERAVVVEDSAVGATAGVAAGMAVLGYAGLTPAARLAAAGATPFEDMRELPGLLAGLASGAA
jgi:HAD superfamily hydrolase (TIGR01509 family)